MAHATLNASGSATWINCPGSIQKIQELIDKQLLIPKERSSQAAMEGTAAHAIGEMVLGLMVAGAWGISATEFAKGFLVHVDPTGDGTLIYAKGDPDLALNKDCPDGWVTFKADDDMLWAVDVLVDHVRGVLEKMGATAEDGIPEDVQVDFEVEVNLGYLGRDDLWGRLDVRICQLMGELHIIDYKHGRGVPVHPAENTQLLYYGLADDCCADMMPENGIFTIVQPRCPKNEAIESWECPIAAVQKWGKEVLIPAAFATEEDNPPIVPGEKQCQWCRAAPYCEAAVDQAHETAVQEFADDLDPDEFMGLKPKEAKDKAKEVLATIEVDRLGRFLSRIPFIDAVIKAAVERGTELLKAGVPVPGQKLVQGQARRRWKEGAEEAFAKKRIAKKYTHKQVFKSFTELEKVEKGQFKDLVAEWTEKPDGKLTMVPEDDKREAIAPPAETDFDDDVPEVPETTQEDDLLG